MFLNRKRVGWISNAETSKVELKVWMSDTILLHLLAMHLLVTELKLTKVQSNVMKPLLITPIGQNRMHG